MKMVPLSIYVQNDSTKKLLKTLTTKEILSPNKTTILTYDFVPTDNNKVYNLLFVADDKGNGKGEYNECNENDNQKKLTFKGNYSIFCQVGKGECMRFAPYTCNPEGKLSCNVKPGKPVKEICDGFDNNCDGQIDEGCGCEGKTQKECYHAPKKFLENNNVCQKGTMNCIGGETWTECRGDILPSVEICNGVDDDCDGKIDEDFPQVGTKCTLGFGICKKSGTYICGKSGNMICDAIPSAPQIEKCGDGLDNNCNGLVDEKPCQK